MKLKINPEKLEDVKTYVANLAKWLAPIKSNFGIFFDFVAESE